MIYFFLFLYSYLLRVFVLLFSQVKLPLERLQEAIMLPSKYPRENSFIKMEDIDTIFFEDEFIRDSLVRSVRSVYVTCVLPAVASAPKRSRRDRDAPRHVGFGISFTFQFVPSCCYSR